jgi:glycosyltransferase involved in cell wall biosynthesis
MKSLLYIGNQLKDSKGTVTAIDVLGPLLEQEGYKLYYASSKQTKFLRLIDMMLTVFKTRKKVDYVLIDTYSTLNFYYAFFVSQLCRCLKLKYIPILHGGNLPARLLKNPILCGALFNHAFKNVSPSNYIKSEFEAYGFSNVLCIPNIIEITNYPILTKDFSSIRMLWVRSFSNIYNPKLAIDVLKRLQDQGLEATLCMVGPEKDGSLSEVKQYANSLDLSVHFTGKLSKQEWIEVSKDYNIFINTTNFDNMPVSVIEAMALGLPVVSTDVGGLPFLIDNNKDGILIEPNNSELFVTAIKELLVKPELTNTMIWSARKKAEQFDWEIVKKQWNKLLV